MRIKIRLKVREARGHTTLKAASSASGSKAASFVALVFKGLSSVFISKSEALLIRISLVRSSGLDMLAVPEAWPPSTLPSISPRVRGVVLVINC